MHDTKTQEKRGDTKPDAMFRAARTVTDIPIKNFSVEDR
jgi:hypothetical protein